MVLVRLYRVKEFSNDCLDAECCDGEFDYLGKGLSKRVSCLNVGGMSCSLFCEGEMR